MFGFLRPAPSADALELGERLITAVDDVRYVPDTIPGHVGRLALTDRHLRFSATGVRARELLHGFPPVSELLGGGASLAIPLAQVEKAWSTRTLGAFTVLHVAVRGGRELVFHVGVRGVERFLRALPK